MSETEGARVDLTGAMWAGPNWKEDLERLKELQSKGDYPRRPEGERQERYILQIHLHPMECPLCHTKVGAKPNEIKCPACGVGLQRVVPLVKVCDPGWNWIIDEESRKELLQLWSSKPRFPNKE